MHIFLLAKAIKSVPLKWEYVDTLRLREFQRICSFSHLSMILSDNVYDFFSFSFSLHFSLFFVSCLYFTSHFNQTRHILFAILSSWSTWNALDHPFKMRFHSNDIAPVYELVHIFNNVNNKMNAHKHRSINVWSPLMWIANWPELPTQNVNWFLQHENRQYLINLRNLCTFPVYTFFSLSLFDCKLWTVDEFSPLSIQFIVMAHWNVKQMSQLRWAVAWVNCEWSFWEYASVCVCVCV